MERLIGNVLKWGAVLAAIGGLVTCSVYMDQHRPPPTPPRIIATINGCKVYRVNPDSESSEAVHTTICPGQRTAPTSTNWSRSSGKTRYSGVHETN